MAFPGDTFERFDHLVLYSRDIEKSLQFYKLLPGLTVGKTKGRGEVYLKKQKINIHPFPSPLSPIALHPAPGAQCFRLLAGGDGMALQSELALAGIAILKDSCSCEFVDSAAFNCFYINDPDGNLINITVAPEIPENGIQFIKGLSIPVSNPEASKAFYGEFLGLKTRTIGSDCVCSFVKSELKLIASGPEADFGSCDFCILADKDIQKIYEALKSGPLVQNLGITERQGATGPLLSIYLKDPDGNLIEISQKV